MTVSIEIILVFMLVLFWLGFVVVCLLMIGRLQKNEAHNRNRLENEILLEVLAGKFTRRAFAVSWKNYQQLKSSLLLDKKTASRMDALLIGDRRKRKYIKRLHSFSTLKRIEAAVNLGLIADEETRIVLEEALRKEKNSTVRLYISSSLCTIRNKKSLPVIIDSLYGASVWYRQKTNVLIADYGSLFEEMFPELIISDDPEIKELLVDYASLNFVPQLKDYLLKIISSADDPLADKAFRIISNNFPQELANEFYLYNENPKIRNLAVRSFASSNDPKDIPLLITMLSDDVTADSADYALSLIIERNPAYINTVTDAFVQIDEDSSLKIHLAGVLAERIDFFIMRLGSRSKEKAASIIRKLIVMGRTAEIIDFVNRNKDLDLENQLLSIIRSAFSVKEELRTEFARYLDPRLAGKLALSMPEIPSQQKQEKRDKGLTFTLCVLLFISAAIVPIIYILRHYETILLYPPLIQLKLYVLDFNYYLIYYLLAINFIYFTLLFFSYVSAGRQYKFWNLKSKSLLFKKNMLPSISIIAPAYNEGKTIVESANSLLNLKYPDFELIIVNDGSKDNTLDVLIDRFDLKRVYYLFTEKIATKEVRGVYVNRSRPQLVVVDKENGGKADSLNVGINVSRKDHFCGIDADSLLEDEALLKLAALSLDEDTEMPAYGGNICTINSCKVEYGKITELRLPDNKLARLQTIEYIRAFMAGRPGWAYLKSLLIISGAFGLFQKDRVIESGGYLTSSGQYRRDTVGEDMELVVRLKRMMIERKRHFRIGYAVNANCWTEVPEKIKNLKSQRHRWHRGLLDILYFHRKMLANPRYGRIGLIAMPYFMIFEAIGPLIEIQGYLLVVVAYFLGVLSIEIALLLFLTTVLIGVVISVSALIIAEKEQKNYSLKDLFVLILFAVIENFGPRQFFSLLRVGGSISMLKKPQGWGKFERQGFAPLDPLAKR